jgi:hypothetical protein
MLALLGAISGCIAGPPIFQPVTSVPADKALVYIYRADISGLRYTVYAGEEPIVQTIGRGYFPYLTDPREVEFWAETASKSSVTLDLEPGQTYYLQAKVDFWLILGRPRLALVSAGVGASEIDGCTLLVSVAADRGVWRRRAPAPPP